MKEIDLRIIHSTDEGHKNSSWVFVNHSDYKLLLVN